MRREDLGRYFTEGSRRLWLALQERGWTQAQARRELGAYAGEIHHVLYGDQRPNLAMTFRMRDVLGIDPEAWTKSPAERFVPPAREARPRRRRAA